MNDEKTDRDAVLSQLDRILNSAPFRQAERSAALLRYVVTRSLDGEGDRLKEYTVGVEALGKGAKFDPRTDPIVRAEASRLRGRLERYYGSEGRTDALVIELPKGSYVARFSSGPTPDGVTTNEAPRRSLPPLLWGMVAVLALTGAFAAGAWRSRTNASAAGSTSRFEIALQSDEEIASEVGTDVAIAPDGSAAAFVSIDSVGDTHLRLRRFDGSAAVDLPGTTGGRGPFWSPDSRWVAFWASGQLRKIAADGGSPVVLCAAPDLLGGSWGEDGTIIAAIDATFRLWRIDAESRRSPEVALDLSAAKIAPRWPQVLPGGSHVIYTSVTAFGDDRATIEVASLTDGTRRVLVQGGTFGRYVGPGHLTFVNQGTLFAQSFDPFRREVRGPAVPIVKDVAYSPVFGYAQISMSETGLAVYRRSPGRMVARLDSNGRQTPILERPGQYSWPSVSPDGRTLALTLVESGVPALVVYTNVHQGPRVAWTVANLDAAVWTRDGTKLVARQGTGQRIVWLPATGGEPQTLYESWRINVPWTFGPNDRQLSFAAMDSATAFDVWTMPIETNGDALVAGPAEPIIQSRSFETFPAISRDGRWLAYSSNESDEPGVYVRSLADTSIKVLVARGGRAPRWSRSGRQLFFTTRTQQIMAVSFVASGKTFEPGTPRLWTSLRLADTGVLPNYDVGIDDGSVIALIPERAYPVNQVVLINGLPAELRRRVP